MEQQKKELLARIGVTKDLLESKKTRPSYKDFDYDEGVFSDGAALLELYMLPGYSEKMLRFFAEQLRIVDSQKIEDLKELAGEIAERAAKLDIIEVDGPMPAKPVTLYISQWENGQRVLTRVTAGRMEYYLVSRRNKPSMIRYFFPDLEIIFYFDEDGNLQDIVSTFEDFRIEDSWSQNRWTDDQEIDEGFQRTYYVFEDARWNELREEDFLKKLDVISSGIKETTGILPTILPIISDYLYSQI